MTRMEAGQVLALLNAAFTEALEETTVALWVSELEPHRFDAAQAAALRIARAGDRFPTLKEFRLAYRQSLDRLNAGRELAEAEVERGPIPDDVKAWARERGVDTLKPI